MFCRRTEPEVLHIPLGVPLPAGSPSSLQLPKSPTAPWLDPGAALGVPLQGSELWRALGCGGFTSAFCRAGTVPHSWHCHPCAPGTVPLVLWEWLLLKPSQDCLFGNRVEPATPTSRIWRWGKCPTATATPSGNSVLLWDVRPELIQDFSSHRDVPCWRTLQELPGATGRSQDPQIHPDPKGFKSLKPSPNSKLPRLCLHGCDLQSKPCPCFSNSTSRGFAIPFIHLWISPFSS